MSAVIEAVEDIGGAVVDAVGDVVEVAADVVEDVGHAVENVVNNALENPVATIATIAAIAAAPATGGASLELIPAINAANTLAQGGSFEDALTSAAISYAAQGVGNYVGGQLGTSLEYGTDLGSSQTAQLAAQSGDMLGGTTSGTIGGAAGSAAAGTTAAVLSGGDVNQALINALGNYAVRTGVNYTVNAAGQIVDEMGRPAPSEVVDEIAADAGSQPTPVTGTTVDNGDGTFTQTFDDGSTLTTDASGNVVQSTTYDGTVIMPTRADVPSVDPYEVDNVGTRDEADILTGTQYGADPYEVDNMGTRDEADILTGTSPSYDILGAAKNYLQNQFVNNLTRQILGSALPSYTTPRVRYTTPTGGTVNDPNAAGTTATTETPDVGFNVGSQAQLASILPEGYLKTEDDKKSTDPFSSDVAEFAKQKFLESQFYDAPEEYAAEGGLIGHQPQFFSEGGAGIQHRYVKGDGDGTSDSVPAMLASGEFVIPADVVSGLGNGDNDAGASVLDRFMQEIRSHKRSAKPDQLPPDSKGPLSYLKAAQKKKVKKHGRS